MAKSTVTFLVVGTCFLLVPAIQLLRSGKSLADFDRRRIASLLILALLVNVSLTVLGQVKAQLDLAFGFTADETLAKLDRLLFGGRDPWLILRWAVHPGMPAAYHYVWILWLACTLGYVGTRPPSDRKDALLISYFALWTVGPVIHALVPAAGPLFYDELGLGSRFAAVPVTRHTRMIENYLWQGYLTRTINFAGGISAMPSLHIATVAWASISLWRTKAFPFSLVVGGYIFVASIVTGWHYAVDGIVGASMAAAIYFAVRRAIRPVQRKPMPRPSMQTLGN